MTKSSVKSADRITNIENQLATLIAALQGSPPAVKEPTVEEMRAAWEAAQNPNPRYAAANPPPVREEAPPRPAHVVKIRPWYDKNDKLGGSVVDFGFVNGKPFSVGPGKARLILEHLGLLRDLVRIDDTLKNK